MKPIDLSKCQFSIIYSVDCHRSIHLDRKQLRPPQFQKNGWDVTESGPSEYEMKGWKHRKYCALLNFDQFCNFVDHVGIYPSGCSTMGSIGAPGFGIGWAPAVSFESDDPDAMQSAYVTPVLPQMMEDMPEWLPGLDPELCIRANMPDWDDVEKTMQEWFEDGEWSAREYAASLAA